MGEVLEVEAGKDPSTLSQPKREEVEEVLNYRIALNFCAKELEEKALSLHLQRQAHALLMQGVRGKDKSPGSFRSDQNWIGPPGARLEEASPRTGPPGGAPPDHSRGQGATARHLCFPDLLNLGEGQRIF